MSGDAARGPGAADHVRRLHARWRRLTALGVPAGYPLGQFPNGPALVAVLAALAGRVLDGRPGAVAFGVFVVALAAWAWEELWRGSNAFRRLLGAGALAWLALRVAGVAG